MCGQRGKCYLHFLHACDILCVTFVFFPLMVMYWRGIWDLWGVFVYPNDVYKRTLTCVPIGSISVIFYIMAPAVEKSLKSYKKSSRKCYYFLVRLYLYTFSMFYMCYWRSVWETADLYMSPQTWQCGLIYVICWAVLCSLGVMRTAIFPPFMVNLDTRDEVLTVCTRFSTKPYTCVFFLDVLFSFFFVITTTIVTWRCCWNFLYNLILPDDPFTADFLCLGLGFLFTLAFFIFEPPLASITRAAERKGWWWKLAWEDFLYTCVFLASVLLWRGGWNSCATYMIPDLFLGGLVNHVAGTIGLMLVQLFSYASALGIGRDGVDPGATAVFPIRYFRHYLLDQEGFVQAPDSDSDETTSTPSTPEEKKTHPPVVSEHPMTETGRYAPPRSRAPPVPPYTQESQTLMLAEDDRCRTFDV